MKTLTKSVLFLALSITAIASTVYTISFEDWTGPESDRDFNDTVVLAMGLLFHSTGVWNRPSPLPNSETPFPFLAADYFDSATATGDLISTFLFQQTAATETAYIRVAGGSWTPIVGTVSLSAAAGDAVDFRLVVQDHDTVYPDAARNSDGMTHAIVAGEPETKSDVPEPEGMLLIGSGLLMLGLGMKLWKR